MLGITIKILLDKDGELNSSDKQNLDENSENPAIIDIKKTAIVADINISSHFLGEVLLKEICLRVEN